MKRWTGSMDSPIDRYQHLSPNFQLAEFMSPDTDEVPADVLENLKLLAEALEKVRTIFGKEIVIDSGYRTEAHNKAVGGAPHSQHLLGKAADIKVVGVSPREVQKTLNNWDGGLGSYSSWTHLDLSTKRRWSGP